MKSPSELCTLPLITPETSFSDTLSEINKKLTNAVHKRPLLSWNNVLKKKKTQNSGEANAILTKARTPTAYKNNVQ